jgi:hypothetical protein
LYDVFSLMFVAIVDHASFRLILLLLAKFVLAVSGARICLLPYYHDVNCYCCCVV